MLSGISALQNAIAPSGAAPVGRTGATGDVGSTSFAEALATKTIGALEKAEAASIEGIKGGLETREVVDAVMSAEQSLQAAIAIRDKIVSAYLEISRMQI